MPSWKDTVAKVSPAEVCHPMRDLMQISFDCIGMFGPLLGVREVRPHLSACTIGVHPRSHGVVYCIKLRQHTYVRVLNRVETITHTILY